MIVSEAAEEILEALWIAHEDTGRDCLKLSELREMPDHKTLRELLDAEIVERCGAEELKLTEKGHEHARDALRRHRLAERLLADLLDIKSELLHETACGFEHHLHKGVDTSVCTLLGHPTVCPHGRPIPPGRCCEEGRKTAHQAFAPLSKLKPGERGHVAYLHTTDPKQAQALLSMGVAPGTAIALLAGYPSYLFQIGEGQFAVDRQIASSIYVRLQS
jgi:DtxR family transcriptional regulator, Mn-dependent transcriptional regulator